MGRHKQPGIRDRILDACADHALAHGLPDRLEPFAAATGVSKRMLIYHFGTRDALLRDTLARARRRQRDLFGALMAPRPGEPYPDTLRRAWREMIGPAGRPYLSMFGRLREEAGQRLWPDFRREATTDWLQPLEDGMRTIGRPELGTLVLAVIRGLILDVDATGDVPRADRAFDDFLATLTPVGAPRAEVGVPRAEVGVPRAEVGVPRAEVGVPRAEVGVRRAEVGVPRGEPRADPGVPRGEPAVEVDVSRAG
ncbi:TetR/AcrR family transcriptional regulator [Actinoplanes sp. NPDC051851]|uniref:TetR/AcrR family transcriptional regulator n=1 Tax=Actinoplanes sp. NPDC051851 TaxID=3154753 RepID=UPI00341E127C